MRDGASGRSRGFGFLTFKDPRTVNVVMVKEHYLDGKIVRPSFSLVSIFKGTLNLDLQAYHIFHLQRSIPSVPFPATNKNERARFLLEE